MEKDDEHARLSWKERVLLGIVTLGCAVLLAQLQAALTNGGDLAYLLPDFVEGKFGPIYRARVLSAWGIRGIVGASRGVLSIETANVILQTVAAWGGLLAVFALARRVLGNRPECWAAPFLAACFVPWGFLEIGFSLSTPYDLPCLALSALGLLAIAAGRLGWLFVVVALGTLNKETAFWLVPAWFFVNHPGWRPRWPVVARAAALFACFAAVYLGARWATTGEPVVTFSTGAPEADGTRPRWLRNLAELLLFGLARDRVFQNVYWAWLIHLPAILYWRALPPLLRRLYGAVPFFLVPIFLVGNLRELRLYNELIPLGAVSAVWVLGPGRKLERRT